MKALVIRTVLTVCLYTTYVDEQIVNGFDSDSVPDGIAIDIASRLVYYTDTGADLIAVMTLDGNHHFTLITEDMDQPRAIVLHPADG